MGNYKRWNDVSINVIREALENNLTPCVISEAFGVNTSTMNKIMVRHGLRKRRLQPGKPRALVAYGDYQPNQYRDKIKKDRIVMAEILRKHNLRNHAATTQTPSLVCGNEYMTSKTLQVIKACERKAIEDRDGQIYISEDLMENWARAHGMQFSKLNTCDGVKYVVAGNPKTPMQFLLLVNRKRVEESGLLPFHVESFI